MGHLAEVRGCVPPRRVVAAPDVPARLAAAQVDPVVAPLRQAVLTPGRGWRHVQDLIEVQVFIELTFFVRLRGLLSATSSKSHADDEVRGEQTNVHEGILQLRR
jgi:hypothetical protein